MTVSLPGPGREVVLIDRQDHEHLIAMGLGETWYLIENGRGRRYVRAYQRNATGNQVTVARLIVGAQHGEVVRYWDGNPLNLTRANLYVDRGRAYRNDELIVRNGALFAPGSTIAGNTWQLWETA